MSVPAESFLPEHSMEIQDRVALAVLKRDVVHLDKSLSEVKTEVKELRADVKSGFQQVAAEFKEVRTEMNQKIDNRFLWTLGALGGTAVAIVGFIVGFIYFFFGAK